ncbi:MAG TPA: 2-oxoglutarate dehydrogenase E1 component [Terriglobales bacterium]|nr:2-oxoglutarate dehydrogenase E1 component [Terriglobales bacterium]
MASHIQDYSTTAVQNGGDMQERERVFDAFRRWGYLQANLDPLGHSLKPVPLPELELSGPFADEARRVYAGTIGAEFMHILDPEKRKFIQDRLEGEPAPVDQQHILEKLIQADEFEQVIQSRYLGTKRFSGEGVSAQIPLIDEILHCAAERECKQVVLAMSHRGRLTVIVNNMGRDASEIFAKFEDVDPRSVLGGGDVKYHLGATGMFTGRNGNQVKIHLVSNPSHLEAVGPVAIGRTRAKQAHFGEGGVDRVFPVIIHGDSAFAGQGMVAETLGFANVKAYTVGGTIHVLANNLIGFTTEPFEYNSSRFSTDLAKRLPVPIFHVNAEDPDAVIRIAKLAVEYRYKFHNDVVIDLIGYRRHGHSEVDDPTITQPVRYAKIKDHPPLSEIYAKQIGVDPKPLADRIRAGYQDAQTRAKQLKKMPVLATHPAYWDRYQGGLYNPDYEVETAITPDQVAHITKVVTVPPSNVSVHPKIQKLLEQRAEMSAGKRPLDYGMAEALAFGSLLMQGIHVRLSGQDTQRGTFNQRHDVLVDVNDEREYFPLQHLAPDQAKFEIYNSTLSEAAVLGFEYGYSRDYPEAFVGWEAQFGDFANGAQIIIDQFVVAGEDKWGLLSGLVMLLPHGYEGQGPEHSSARIERYLQLCARDNIQVCQPSTAAQYFHLLRRQVLRTWRKPLICFTPKSMLRHPDASSPISEITSGRFQPIIPDIDVQDAKRIVVCTGKIGREIRMERKKRKNTDTAVIFVEQLYPLAEGELRAALNAHPNATEIVWVQEEPANMGALYYMIPRLKRLSGGRPVLSVKRSASATPSTGSAKAHEMEQRTLIDLALGGK